MNLVWKLLRQHISIPQFVGFFFANIIGLIIILLALQFYKDINAVYDSEDSLMKENYIIVNKKVAALDVLTGNDNSFSQHELEDLKRQPFVRKMGVFTPSAFRVSAGFDIDQLARFSTEMFFESVPDEFVDVDKENWKFNKDEMTIPIVIPKGYLDLYNFGFAQSQNMPKLSEGVLQAIKIDINIKTNDDVHQFKGKIAGFSNRLNTILVPDEFMKMANETYAPHRESHVSRVVLQVDNPTDDRITSYLQDNNYETDEDKLDASKTNYLLKILVAVVIAVGAVISILAFFILMLSIYLLVEKNSSKLENLLLLGYSTAKVARPYQILTILLNILVALLAVLAVIGFRKIYLNLFIAFFPDMTTPPVTITFVAAACICTLMSVVNFLAIKRKVNSIWNNKS